MSDFEMDDPNATEVREVIAWLHAKGIPFVRCTFYHLKIEEVNYYFGRGKIMIDGSGKSHPDRGLPALQSVLRKLGYLRS